MCCCSCVSFRWVPLLGYDIGNYRRRLCDSVNVRYWRFFRKSCVIQLMYDIGDSPEKVALPGQYMLLEVLRDGCILWRV